MKELGYIIDEIWLMFYLSIIHVMLDVYKHLESLVFECKSCINYGMVES